jgi:hypothetical protein
MLIVACFLAMSSGRARATDAWNSQAVLIRPGADLEDLYVFPSPQTPQNVVIVLTVQPWAGNIVPTAQFDPSVLLQIKIDNSGRSFESGGSPPVENLELQFTFGPGDSGEQVTVHGPASVKGPSDGLIAATGSGPTGQAFTLPNGIQVFAGLRQDPAFVDLSNFYAILPDRYANQFANPLEGLYQFPIYSANSSCLPAPLGNGMCDGFTEPAFGLSRPHNWFVYGVLAVVIELPRSMLTAGGTQNLAIWATSATQSGS